jgi:hypothetical protein
MLKIWIIHVKNCGSHQKETKSTNKWLPPCGTCEKKRKNAKLMDATINEEKEVVI